MVTVDATYLQHYWLKSGKEPLLHMPIYLPLFPVGLFANFLCFDEHYY